MAIKNNQIENFNIDNDEISLKELIIKITKENQLNPNQIAIERVNALSLDKFLFIQKIYSFSLSGFFSLNNS